MTRDDIEAIRQELKGIKSTISVLNNSNSTATSNNQVISNNILTTINDSLNAIEANSSSSTNIKEFEQDIFYDKTNVTKFYKIRDIYDSTTTLFTTSILNIDGTVPGVLPLISNLVQVLSSIDYEFNTIERKAITAGTGYSVNDRIQELQIINMSVGTLINTIWVNKTTSLLIAAPIFSHLVIDDSYANIANQVLHNAKLDTINSSLNDIKNYTDNLESLAISSNTKLTNIDAKDFSIEATQLLVKAKTDNLNVLLSTRASEVTLSALNTKVITTANGIKVDGSFVTQPISVSALPLPIGAATSANQQTNAITDLQIRATPLVISGNVVTGGLTNAEIRATALPISGTVNTGLLQGITDTQIRATPLPISGTIIANIGTVNGLALDTSVNSLLKPASTLAAITSITNAVTIKADTLLNQTNPLKVDATATTQPVSVVSLPLPVSASTSALQTTGNTFLNTIDGKIPTGLTVTANKLQVELPASSIGLTDTQIRATPLAVTMSNTLALTDTQIRATALPVSIATDADNTSTGTLAAAAQTVVLTMSGKSAVGIVITGTWVGTITFEGSVDGTNWNLINAVAASTSIPQSTTIVNGLFRLTPSGLLQVRANMTAFTSGTATLTMRASAGTGGTFANQVVPVTIISNLAEGVVSVGNSSIVNLAANAVFTGTTEDVTVYANIKVNVYSSHASATNGLNYQQSHDGILWIPLTDAYTIPALSQKSFSIGVNMKFFRVVYTNGATTTTTLVIQSLYHKSDKQASSVRPQDGRSNDNDFIEELSFLMGYNSTADAWNRVGITSGNLGGNETLLDRLKVNASLRMLDTAQAVGSQLVGATGTQLGGLNVNIKNSSTLAITTTAASGVAATLTIPAVAGQFHYITSIKMLLYSTAARTGTATPIIVTSTNTPGTLSFSFDTAGAIGTSVTQEVIQLLPLKSSVVNTATTIVAPIVAGGIWRITATYYTGA